jgi:hypothetical protein
MLDDNIHSDTIIATWFLFGPIGGLIVL